MPEMTKEQMIEMIQDIELIEWNKMKTMENMKGYHDSATYAKRNRWEAIRDLMKEVGIKKKEEIKRI